MLYILLSLVRISRIRYLCFVGQSSRKCNGIVAFDIEKYLCIMSVPFSVWWRKRYFSKWKIVFAVASKRVNEQALLLCKHMRSLRLLLHTTKPISLTIFYVYWCKLNAQRIISFDDYGFTLLAVYPGIYSRTIKSTHTAWRILQNTINNRILLAIRMCSFVVCAVCKCLRDNTMEIRFPQPFTRRLHTTHSTLFMPTRCKLESIIKRTNSIFHRLFSRRFFADALAFSKCICHSHHFSNK